ncbi:MAG: YiiX family permuted papain-like enzyme [Chitinophagales bacterium]
MRLYLAALGLLFLFGCKHGQHNAVTLPEGDALRNGDIIFQTSLSNQSMAVQLATHSKWSHMGLLFQQNGKWFVYEAGATVKSTPLEAWIKHGKDGHYVVKRLKDYDSYFTSETEQKMKAAANKYVGKKYDLYFEWSDDRIYCSELVWKIYNDALNIQVGDLQQIKEFDLSSATVQQKIKERYGSNIPLDEPVISPQAMFESKLLREVITE